MYAIQAVVFSCKNFPATTLGATWQVEQLTEPSGSGSLRMLMRAGETRVLRDNHTHMGMGYGIPPGHHLNPKPYGWPYDPFDIDLVKLVHTSVEGSHNGLSRNDSLGRRDLLSWTVTKPDTG